MSFDEQVEILQEFDEGTEITDYVGQVIEAATTIHEMYPHQAQIILEVAKFMIFDQIPFLTNFDELALSDGLLELVGFTDD